MEKEANAMGSAQVVDRPQRNSGLYLRLLSRRLNSNQEKVDRMEDCWKTFDVLPGLIRALAVHYTSSNERKLYTCEVLGRLP